MSAFFREGESWLTLYSHVFRYSPLMIMALRSLPTKSSAVAGQIAFIKLAMQKGVFWHTSA